jgi:large subunit ribosomal protein L17
MVARLIKDKAVLQELFDAIAPVVESRNGGYARVIKTGFRRGDAARTAIIELVDWSNPQDGAMTLKGKKKVTKKIVKTAPKAVKEVAPVIAATPIVAIEEAIVETPILDATFDDVIVADEVAPETSEENPSEDGSIVEPKA